MVFKNKDFKKKGLLNDDIIGDELEVLHKLELIDDNSLISQKEKILHMIKQL